MMGQRQQNEIMIEDHQHNIQGREASSKKDDFVE